MKFKSVLSKYWLDIALAIIFGFIAFDTALDHGAWAFAFARKIALASLGLVYYYITRLIKLGNIEWRDPYDKIYSLVLLIYIAIVFSLG